MHLVWLLLNVDVHNTFSQHKLPCLVLHGLQKPISFRPLDFATSLFTILLLARIYIYIFNMLGSYVMKWEHFKSSVYNIHTADSK